MKGSRVSIPEQSAGAPGNLRVPFRCDGRRADVAANGDELDTFRAESCSAQIADSSPYGCGILTVHKARWCVIFGRTARLWQQIKKTPPREADAAVKHCDRSSMLPHGHCSSCDSQHNAFSGPRRKEKAPTLRDPSRLPEGRLHREGSSIHAEVCGNGAVHLYGAKSVTVTVADLHWRRIARLGICVWCVMCNHDLELLKDTAFNTLGRGLSFAACRVARTSKAVATARRLAARSRWRRSAGPQDGVGGSNPSCGTKRTRIVRESFPRRATGGMGAAEGSSSDDAVLPGWRR